MATFEERQNQLQKTIEGLTAMQLPVEELLAASKKQSDTFDCIKETVNLGMETQNRILATVHDIQGKSSGNPVYLVIYLSKILEANIISRPGNGSGIRMYGRSALRILETGVWRPRPSNIGAMELRAEYIRVLWDSWSWQDLDKVADNRTVVKDYD
jgi:hypothetical protein